jgi:predicted CoA-binding protein
MPRGDASTISRLLRYDTWAIVGLTGDPSRDAFGVARMLQRNGKRIIPINPRGEAVHGEPGYRTLDEVPGEVDVVDIFRRADKCGVHVDEAIAIGAKAVWMQLTVVDEAAADRAEKAGLAVVMDRCPAIEWPAHGPRAR